MAEPIPYQEWHASALDLLTGEWQRQVNLVRENPGFEPDLAWVLDDLEYMGLAERQVMPIYRGAQIVGSSIWWRKNPNPPAEAGT